MGGSLLEDAHFSRAAFGEGRRHQRRCRPVGRVRRQLERLRKGDVALVGDDDSVDAALQTQPIATTHLPRRRGRLGCIETRDADRRRVKRDRCPAGERSGEDALRNQKGSDAIRRHQECTCQ